MLTNPHFAETFSTPEVEFPEFHILYDQPKNSFMFNQALGTQISPLIGC